MDNVPPLQEGEGLVLVTPLGSAGIESSGGGRGILVAPDYRAFLPQICPDSIVRCLPLEMLGLRRNLAGLGFSLRLPSPPSMTLTSLVEWGDGVGMRVSWGGSSAEAPTFGTIPQLDGYDRVRSVQSLGVGAFVKDCESGETLHFPRGCFRMRPVFN